MRRAGVKGLNFGKRRKKLNMPLLKEIGAWVMEIAIVLIVSFVFVYFIGHRTTVVGSSMNPSLENGEEILVNRFTYKVTQPKANDVIVFLPHGNEKSHYYIKRVIAVPGDTVQIKNGAVYVNGGLFDEKAETAAIEDAGVATDEIMVGEDEYFVLGDNRNSSEDSRYANIGNVKKEHIVGKAWFRVSPFKKIGFIK